MQKSSLKLEENDFILLYNLFILYLLDTNFDSEIISLFSELVEKNQKISKKIRIIIREEF